MHPIPEQSTASNQSGTVKSRSLGARRGVALDSLRGASYGFSDGGRLALTAGAFLKGRKDRLAHIVYLNTSLQPVGEVALQENSPNQYEITSTMMATIDLSRIAHARSGDKGNHANIGVIAYTAAGYDFLRQTLSAERVAEYFAGLHPTNVVRYELPKIAALNFVLYDVLAGGASQSLRIDTQGKLLSTAIGELQLPEPENLAAMLRNG